MQKITPFLWFDGKAEEAARFYVSVFPSSRIVQVDRWGEGAPFPKGSVMGVEFELEGLRFSALNGGPMFTFTPAISFFVSCETQAEIDALWDRLLAGGGKPQQCGWLTDRFGVSWQIVPEGLRPLIHDEDPARAARVIQAMMQMVKLDLAALKRAHAGA